jgi:hypothetical protein
MSRLHSDIAAATMPAFIIKLDMNATSAGSSTAGAAKLRAIALEDVVRMLIPSLLCGEITMGAPIGSRCFVTLAGALPPKPRDGIDAARDEPGPRA